MSLRARLIAGMVVVAGVLAVAAGLITRTTESNLLQQVDAQLVAAGNPLRGYDPGGHPHPPGDDLGGPERLSEAYVGVVSSDGTLTPIYTPNLRAEAEAPLPVIDGQEALDRAGSGEAFTVGSKDSSMRYRVLAVDDPRVSGTVVLALPLDVVDETVHRLIVVEVAATIAILAVLALVTWWVIQLGVQPIKRMTATATAIAGGDLSHRVEAMPAGTEAGELGGALNQMLGRIEDAFDERTQSELRLRRFIADASHELRTPVTTIRGYAELYRVGGLEQAADLDEAMRRTEQEAVRMGTLVDDLLQLARLDQGRPLERQPVDLAAVASDAVRDARAVDPARPISAEVSEPLTVVGDDGRLRQVVANLIGNALVHTAPGTPIEVRVARDDGHAVLEVRDHGQGMPPDVAKRAFERFYRADPSRSRHRGGSGLGLAIVEATIAAHGGTVSLDSEVGVGTTVRIELPAQPDAVIPTVTPAV
jgi:two-component system OmpR family sensor kinase